MEVGKDRGVFRCKLVCKYYTCSRAESMLENDRCVHVPDCRCGTSSAAGSSSNSLQVLLWHRESRMACQVRCGE